MNTSSTQIHVSNLTIEKVRKDIKIHLGVYPPNGRIRVAVPLKTSDESVDNVDAKIDSIKAELANVKKLFS